MKKITIPFRVPVDTVNEAGKETVVHTPGMLEHLGVLRKRSQAVIQSSLDIEEWIKDILGEVLFKRTGSEDYRFLKGLFLESDFCMFNTKIKLLNSSLQYFKLLNGKERNEVENILSKVNRYRNIFAHGKIFPKNKRFYVSYFDGAQVTKELNEEYWAEVEGVLNRAHNLMKTIEAGVRRPVK